MGEYTTLASGRSCVWMGSLRTWPVRRYRGFQRNQDTLLLIGEVAVIGAGACVTKSIPAGVTGIGVPARLRPSSD